MKLELETFLGLAEKSRLQNIPLYIWIAGTIASGKTTLRQQLEKELSPLGQIGVFTDGKYILEEVARDTEFKYHRVNPETGGFIVTNSAIDFGMRRRLIKDLHDFKGNFCLIELTIGTDRQGVRDMTFKSLIDLIDPDILKQSFFVYLQCPYEERILRNEQRSAINSSGDYRKVNPAALERFGFTDDFLDAAQFLSRPYFIINTK